MSKIYEALLRAELDRTVIDDRAENPVSAQDSVSPVHEMVAAEAANARSHAIEPANLPFFAEPPAERLNAPLDLSLVAQRPWKPALVALPALGERGPEVEQFRNLRSHLTEFRDSGPLKSVLVSSGLPGEGKTFIALNLALVFARHKGNRVLLIDGDMRRSSLHKSLGAPREPGLTEYLSGEVSLLEVMQRPSNASALPAGLASLVFIGGGKDASKAGDLAANARFAELIAKASATFDWIIVDSSPATLVSDAVSLAHACDGVLLVGREGVTRYKTAQEAQTQFKSANVLGFVLNAVHNLPQKSDYYGSYDSYRAEA